ncbi:MAG: hypothetical protein JWO36_4983 [Myxococcales bacterium]|nr:hypothetical protein [Myxococcales bacterium]
MKRFVIALAVAHGSAAYAFPTGAQFDLDPLKADGGGGIAFDGAPRWSSHTCAVCHTDPPGIVGLRLESDHPELFTDGWKPQQQYHLRVVLTNEWAGVQYQTFGDACGFSQTPYRPCDENGFALELDDEVGQPKGKFVPFVGSACANTGTPPTDVDVRVLADGTAVTHNGAHMGMTSWDLCWTAPGAGVGPITAFVAAVDGNGGNGTLAFPNDTVGDDVAAGAVPIPELDANPVSPQTGGCSADGGDRGILIALLVLVLVVHRRRRSLIALLAIAALSGCVHVRARQRETLAKRNMKFAPDPAEDELDLHMQEAREGSSGGYGSSGGGCGCN